MKVELRTGTDCNDLEIHEVYINGKHHKTIQDLSDCPEDAHIGRDLIDGHHIMKYIQMGYDAAKNGETLDFIKNDIEES